MMTDHLIACMHRIIHIIIIEMSSLLFTENPSVSVLRISYTTHVDAAITANFRIV